MCYLFSIISFSAHVILNHLKKKGSIRNVMSDNPDDLQKLKTQNGVSLKKNVDKLITLIMES